MTGQIVSHYTILEKLGEGGMGVVYKARDTTLNRDVAIKFLPPHIAKAGIERDRFLQEAQAAAAINHPNICVIYEIGEDTEQPYIVMEYVDGMTIRTKLESGPYTVDDAITYGIQIGEALQEAHSKGIVHRDIKADNIIINSKGQAKVMDFGLAKWKGSMKLTRASSTVGTLGYMAPEQIQGGEVDTRSDIFAFAVLFFEMITGHLPFRGEHEAAMVYSIVNEDPEPIEKYVPGISAEIVHALAKALEKDPDDRYQTIQDMVVDLRRSKKDSTKVGRIPMGGALQSNSQIAGERPPIRSSNKGFRFGTAVGMIVIAAGLVYYFVIANNSSESLPPMKAVAFTTFPGLTRSPAISPEGNAIAFVWNGEHENNFDLYVKLIDAGSPLRLTTDPGEESNPAWSPDGRFIAFSRTANKIGSIYIIPSLGGAERKIADFPLTNRQIITVGNGLDWSPDGKTLAVSTPFSDGGIYSIVLIDIETGQKKQLATPDINGWGDFGPKFSPDGKLVVFGRSLSPLIVEVFTIPVGGGKERRLTFDDLHVESVAWTADGKEIVFSSNRGGAQAMWRIPKNGGSVTSIQNSGEYVIEVALGKNGSTLAYTREVTNSNIWQIDPEQSTVKRTPPVKLITSRLMEKEPQYSPDGKSIAFASERSGNNEIWVCRSDGTSPTQLTFYRGVGVGTPRWSPDSRSIAFDSREKGNGNIYVISANGGTPRQLTSGTYENNIPSWSRDGRWIYYSSNRTGTFQIWKVAVDGGQEAQVTQNGGFSAFESLDGAYLYFVKDYNNNDIMRIPAKGGEEELVDAQLKGIKWGLWELTENGIYFAKLETNERGHIYFYNFSTKKITPIIVTDKQIWPFSGGMTISPDRHSLLFTQIDRKESDIMLIQNFH